jgi:hypothetical protein
MRRRFRQFMSLLDDEPAFDPSVALFRQGMSINEVVGRLAPTLGGPAMVAGQRVVQGQIQSALDKQVATIHEQAETIEGLREYVAKLVEHIETQECVIVGLRRALAHAQVALRD